MKISVRLTLAGKIWLALLILSTILWLILDSFIVSLVAFLCYLNLAMMCSMWLLYFANHNLFDVIHEMNTNRHVPKDIPEYILLRFVPDIKKTKDLFIILRFIIKEDAL